MAGISRKDAWWCTGWRPSRVPEGDEGRETGGESEPAALRTPADPVSTDRHRTGLDDPRALQILTTEHWSLLSTRTLGYHEMFGRATIFTGVVSGTVVALALLAQATHFRPETL